MSNLLSLLNSTKFACAIIALASLAVYMPFLNAPAHLDDQFLINWLNNLKGGNFAEFINWTGPDKLDAWGPLIHYWFIAKAAFIKKSIWLWRLAGLLMHILTSIFVYLIVKRLPSVNNTLTSLSSALLFSVYPLCPEAVFWISGKASQLSALFFLIALYLGLRYYKDKILPWLVGGIVLLIAGLLTQTNFAVSQEALHFENWYRLFRNLFFPINNEIVPKYAREYRFMYVLIAPALIGLIFAVWKNKQYRTNLSLALGLLIVLLLPYVGFATVARNLYGSRFLYLASFAACLVLTYVFTSFANVSKRLKPLTYTASSIFLLLLFVFFTRMTWMQNSAYRQATHVLQSIQKSAAVVVAKTNSPYLFVRDLPRNASVVPAPMEYSIAALEGTTGLLSAWVVPPERLKRALHKDNYLERGLRWDKDFLALVAYDLTPSKNDLTQLDGDGIVRRMMPGLIFYRTASFDAQNKCLVLESNSTVSGPAVRLSADGLSPIDSDVIYVDARINGPNSNPGQEVELYWTTRLLEDYNHEDRRSFTQAVVNDGQFHRYYLPLSAAGYFVNGTIANITLGFPAGSKVWVKGLGVVDGEKLRAHLEIQPSSIKEQTPFASPYYQYPQIADLGLAQIGPSGELSFTYSVGNVEGAVSAILEISHANTFFKNPNGDALSAASLKKIPLAGTEGQWSLKRSELADPGVYSIRLIAASANGRPVGGFSDSINLLAR